MEQGYRISSENEKMEYFLQHYLPKQEVLYRLPLNIPISSFWPELLNRRKAKAIVLPLHNAAGMPYWYNLTEKMVAASEQLSQEATCYSGNRDPYRMKMTAAMTQEMYFTSFVEGAEYPVEEAMAFLSEDREPENILEQMIWNNRRAWEFMIANLYRPVNEGSIRSLVYVLTEGMDHCAEDYRRQDTHPIAAMQGEPYEVPHAARIPELMEEYYRFMNDPEVHPLIKASVGAAYLLVARPFPEGNERLSRMISSLVLLRSGYGFFQDMSLSSVIAKETWSYYQSMCEILRSHNEGDLTYFIEYFLEMLVRAMDQKKEQEKTRGESLISQEQQMAREPLTPINETDLQPSESGTEWDQSGLPDRGGGKINPEPGNSDWLMNVYQSLTANRKRYGGNQDNSLEIKTVMSWIQCQTYLSAFVKERLCSCLQEDGYRAIRMAAVFSKWISEGKTSFTTKEYMAIVNKGKKTCRVDTKLAQKYGLLRRKRFSNIWNYEIVQNPEEGKNLNLTVRLSDPDILLSGEGNVSTWLLEQYPLIYQNSRLGKGGIDLSEVIGSVNQWINSLKMDQVSPELKERLHMMLLQTGGIRSIRLIAFLIPWVAGGHKTFHAKEYQEILGIKKNPCCADVRLAKDYGLICTHRGGKRITYEIQTNPCGTSMEESSATGSGSINKRIQIWGKKENRTERQQMILDALREKFDHGIFTSSLAAKALEIDLDDFRYYIRVLVEQGAVQREWIETHYEYTVMQDVEEEKQAERIREHLAHKYLISSETTEASYTETAAAG